MGLFDFIKKKLFGKTKKVEESKKVDKKKDEKSPKVKSPSPKPKLKKKPEPSKEISLKKEPKKPKKGLFTKIKEAIISSPKKEEIKEKQEKEIKKAPVPKKVKRKIKEEEPEVKEEVVKEIKEEEPEVKKEVVEEIKEEKPEVKKEVVEEIKEEEPEVKEEVVEEIKEEEPEVKEEAAEDEDSIKKGLEKTKKSFFSKLKSAIIGKSKIDDEVLDDLEEVLITSDVGVETTVKIIERIEDRVSKEKYTSVNELNNLLKDEIVKILAENSSDLDAFDVAEDAVPYVILVVGVNGVGKTTTIGKLAAQFKEGGLNVLIGAADTFRAAAVDQILMWGKKVGVDVVSHGMNTDPASVAYDTVKKAVEENYDVVIIDTAGRLHTKLNLMNELSKIKRVVQKFKEDAPHEVMLILDGSTGQNAFVQAEEFTKVTDVNSITITKLDGTAKGGVVIGITDQFKIPIKYIGVGEKIGDLKLFHKGEFVNSFFD